MSTKVLLGSLEFNEEFEEWLLSVLPELRHQVKLTDYYKLNSEVQEEVELMYLQGDFYTAIEHINNEITQSLGK